MQHFFFSHSFFFYSLSWLSVKRGTTCVVRVCVCVTRVCHTLSICCCLYVCVVVRSVNTFCEPNKESQNHKSSMQTAHLNQTNSGNKHKLCESESAMFEWRHSHRFISERNNIRNLKPLLDLLDHKSLLSHECNCSCIEHSLLFVLFEAVIHMPAALNIFIQITNRHSIGLYRAIA